ncbi:MAG: hypothetical protein A2201_08530 [Alicyclobacillus sp. RIFOXYA1_FULL_53_8]|nr:MAG: hypothetical protein A2201_08530 [Alicyclobacillus sp. RIFOXYA1_FULL_53_8]
MIVGCGTVALIYHDRVNQHPKLGIKILGYVADSPQTKVMPFLGELSDLRSVLRDHQIDGVVVTLPLTDPRMESVINECELHGVPVELTLDNLSSKLVHSRGVHGLGVPRLTLSQASQEPFAVELKRVTDIVLSGAALVLFSPVFLVIAIAIKLDDGGPVLFAQTRVGQFGRMFKIHKFRSMGLDAEKMRHQLLHLNEMSGTVFKISDDPRVTRNWALVTQIQLR